MVSNPASGTGTPTNSRTIRKEAASDPRTTFREAVESFPMGDGHDFYAVTGVVDSIVRERVFEELSKRLDCGYGTVYDAWLHHTGLDPDLLGTKSTRMRHDIEDMLGAGSYATVDAIADHMAADRHLRSVIREAGRSTAIGSRDFEKGLGSAVADHPRIGRLMDDDRFKDLIYDMVHDGRRFSTPVQDDAIVSGADAPAAEAGAQSEARGGERPARQRRRAGVGERRGSSGTGGRGHHRSGTTRLRFRRHAVRT